ncbi:hypothetical protein [Streptomyces sp. 900105755]
MGTRGSSAAWRGRVLAPVLIYLSSVVAVISSLGAPLIPTIAAADHVSLSEAQWSLTITLLVGAVATAQPGLHHALVLLADRIPVTAVAHACGGSSAGAFAAPLAAAFGDTPGAHRC